MYVHDQQVIDVQCLERTLLMYILKSDSTLCSAFHSNASDFNSKCLYLPGFHIRNGAKTLMLQIITAGNLRD